MILKRVVLLFLAAQLFSSAAFTTLAQAVQVSVSNELQPPLDVSLVFFSKNLASTHGGNDDAIAWLIHDVPPLSTLTVVIPGTFTASAEVSGTSTSTPAIPVSPAYLYSLEDRSGYSLGLDGYANSLDQIQFQNRLRNTARFDVFKGPNLYAAVSKGPGRRASFELPEEIWLNLADHSREGCVLSTDVARSATRFSLHGYTQVNIAMVGGGVTPITFVVTSAY